MKPKNRLDEALRRGRPKSDEKFEIPEFETNEFHFEGDGYEGYGRIAEEVNDDFLRHMLNNLFQTYLYCICTTRVHTIDDPQDIPEYVHRMMDEAHREFRETLDRGGPEEGERMTAQEAFKRLCSIVIRKCQETLEEDV